MSENRRVPGDVQGVALIERVIEHVRANTQALPGMYQPYSLAKPKPLPADVIETLSFPDGKALPPSLKRWLAFDASWLASLGWFASPSSTRLTSRRLDTIAQDVFGDPWGELYTPLGSRFEMCFLLPGGSDSRRLYAVTDPDPLGEYPVLVIDVDDLPYTGLMYPGFDVYLAVLAGLIAEPSGTYTALFANPHYAPRLQWHAQRLFQGAYYIDYGQAEAWGDVSPS